MNFGGLSKRFKLPQESINDANANVDRYIEEQSELGPTNIARNPFKMEEMPTPNLYELLKKDFQERYQNAEDEAEPLQRYDSSRFNREADRADERQLAGSLLDSAALVGNFRGKPVDSDGAENAQRINAEKQAQFQRGMQLKNLNEQNQMQNIQGFVGAHEAQRKNEFENAENDPNSEISQNYRDLASQFFGGQQIPERASAAFIQKNLPGIQSLYQKQEDRNFQENLAKERMGQAKEEKNKDRNFQRENLQMTLNARKQTGEGKEDKNKSDLEVKLFDKFNKEPLVTNYDKIQTSLAQAEDLVSAPSSPSNDQSLIIMFNKILDPTSVVREGEFAITERGGGALNSMQQAFEKFKGDGRLTPDVRQKMIGAIRILSGEAKSAYDRKKYQYSEFAKKQGLDPSRILIDQNTNSIQQPQQPRRVWKPGGAP
jgi:hypothetical protein